jgi:hypothetical protein
MHPQHFLGCLLTQNRTLTVHRLNNSTAVARRMPTALTTTLGCDLHAQLAKK